MIRDMMPNACSFIPFTASQRGLSGIRKAITKKSPAGMFSAQNIIRQPVCPFQDSRMSATVAPAATGSARSQFTSCAARMPSTIVSWLSDTKRPRSRAGETSAIYIGERLEVMPMANPPRIRYRMNIVNVFAAPVPTAETKNRAADMTSIFLRP